MRGDALQMFKRIGSPSREKVAEILIVFRRKYVKPYSMATAKHKFQRLVFNPANQKLIQFLDEFQKLAKNAFGFGAQAIIEHFLYTKMPPHLRKSINQAHLENCTYQQIASHVGRELELNGLKAPDEMQINNVTQQASKPNIERPKPTCHHLKKPGHCPNQWRQLRKDGNQNDTNKNSQGNIKNSNNNSGQTISNTQSNITAVSDGKASSANNRKGRKARTVYSPYDIWQNEPFHREMLIWSQCSKQTASSEKKTDGTNSKSTTKDTDQYN